MIEPARVGGKEEVSGKGIHPREKKQKRPSTSRAFKRQE
jgi:hypothetical protein